MNHSCENDQQLKCCRKTFITDVWLGCKYTSIPYMTYLSKMCVSTKKMVAGLANKKCLKKQQTKTN